MPDRRRPRLLLVKLADMGDAVVLSAAVDAGRRALPSWDIDLLLGRAGAPVYACDDRVRRVWSFDRTRVEGRRAFSPGSLLAWGRLLWELRRERYDAVVVAHHLTTTLGTLKLLSVALGAGAPLRVGLDNGRGGGWLTLRLRDRGFGASCEGAYWARLVSLLAGEAPGGTGRGVSRAGDDGSAAGDGSSASGVAEARAAGVMSVQWGMGWPGRAGADRAGRARQAEDARRASHRFIPARGAEPEAKRPPRLGTSDGERGGGEPSGANRRCAPTNDEGGARLGGRVTATERGTEEGADPSDGRLGLRACPDAAARAADLLADAPRPVLAVHHGLGGWIPARAWRAEGYAAVIRAVHRRCGGTILLVGGPEERAAAQEVVRLAVLPGVRVLAGETSVQELAAVLASADAFLGPDAGPAQLAGALGVPSVTLWGPTNERAWGACPEIGAGPAVMLRAPDRPAPWLYVGHRMGDVRRGGDLGSIDPELVAVAVLETLERGRGGRG